MTTIPQIHIINISGTMVATPEEELKAEEELLNENHTEPNVTEESATVDQAAEDADLAENNANGDAGGKELPKNASPDMEETHISEFDISEHANQFFEEIKNLRDQKNMNDGNIVFASEGNENF